MAERILLVEDDPRLADMLFEYLGQAGFGVTVASRGAVALEKLGEAGYDAVVLDLMLPDMDGLDVCRQLRARDDTPVLMLTARGDAVDRIVGLELGVWAVGFHGGRIAHAYQLPPVFAGPGIVAADFVV